MKWYYFNLHSVDTMTNEETTGEVHVEESSLNLMAKGVRRINPNLYDLPSGTGLWHGYIRANDDDSAISEVLVAY